MTRYFVCLDNLVVDRSVRSKYYALQESYDKIFSRKEELYNPIANKLLTDSNKILCPPATEKRERNNVVRSNGYCRINPSRARYNSKI